MSRLTKSELWQDIRRSKAVPLHILDDAGLELAQELVKDRRATIEYGELRALHSEWDRESAAERAAQAHQRSSEWPPRRYYHR